MGRVIQTPGPSGQLTEELGIKGALQLQLDETLVPVTIVRPRERRAAFGATVVAASAVVKSMVALVNPLGTGGPDLGGVDTSIEVNKIHVSVSTDENVLIVRTSAGVSGFDILTTKAFKRFADGLGPAAVFLSDQAAAPAGVIVDRKIVGGGLVLTFDYSDDPIILDGRGGTVLVRTDSDNVAMTVVLEWTEPALPI